MCGVSATTRPHGWASPHTSRCCTPSTPPFACDAAVAEVVAGFAPFEFSLARLESFWSRVLWAAPEPAERFVALTSVLADAFPDHPRYGGEFGDDITPHLTIADGAEPHHMRAGARAVTELLPVHSRLDEVALLVGGDERGSWRVRDRFPLGAGAHHVPAATAAW